MSLPGLQQIERQFLVAHYPRAYHKKMDRSTPLPQWERDLSACPRAWPKGKTPGLAHNLGPTKMPSGEGTSPSASLQAHRAIFLYKVYVVCTYYISSFPTEPFQYILKYNGLCNNYYFHCWAIFNFFNTLITYIYCGKWTSIHISSGTLSIRSNPLNLFVTSTV